jgi:hypothetical protein
MVLYMYMKAKKPQKKLTISKKKIQKAVQGSSKIEGLSFYSAKKNKKAIKILKKYGRAFSL